MNIICQDATTVQALKSFKCRKPSENALPTNVLQLTASVFNALALLDLVQYIESSYMRVRISFCLRWFIFVIGRII